jgi:hypothetical protein
MLSHEWVGSGKEFKSSFKKNWDYFINKWKEFPTKLLIHGT